MDVTVLLTPRQPGGHEKALFHWLRDAIDGEGLQARIVCIGSDMVAACKDAGLQQQLCAVDARRLDFGTLWRALQQAPRSRPLLLAPGVVHAQAWVLAVARALGHQVWCYVPMTHRASTMGYRWATARDWLLAPLLRSVHGWVTIDERQRTTLRDAWGIAAPVYLLRNRARVEAASDVRPTPDDRGRLRVAYVGRFDPWQKGLDWLADGIAADAPWAREHHFRFQGAGPAEARLRALAAAKGSAKVECHPYGPLQQALMQSDVLLLPSRYEGLPLVALEATALGWPVVASRQAGLDALLPATSCFEFGDHAGLARSLAALRNPSARALAVAHAQARLASLQQPALYAAELRALLRHWRGGDASGQTA